MTLPPLQCVTCGADIHAAGMPIRCRACRAVVMCMAHVPARRLAGRTSGTQSVPPAGR